MVTAGAVIFAFGGEGGRGKLFCIMHHEVTASFSPALQSTLNLQLDDVAGVLSIENTDEPFTNQEMLTKQTHLGQVSSPLVVRA